MSPNSSHNYIQFTLTCILTLKVIGKSLPMTSFSRTPSVAAEDMTHLNRSNDFLSFVAPCSYVKLLLVFRIPFVVCCATQSNCSAFFTPFASIGKVYTNDASLRDLLLFR